jgi:hypothetical protein
MLGGVDVTESSGQAQACQLPASSVTKCIATLTASSALTELFATTSACLRAPPEARGRSVGRREQVVAGLDRPGPDLLGTGAAALRRASGGRAQDAALPAVARCRPGGPPRPPPDPAPAAHLALGGRAGGSGRVHPPASTAAALLTLPLPRGAGREPPT